MHQGLAPDAEAIDTWAVSEIPDPPDHVIMNLRAWCIAADDDALAFQRAPTYFVLVRETMPFRQGRKNGRLPQDGGVAVRR